MATDHRLVKRCMSQCRTVRWSQHARCDGTLVRVPRARLCLSRQPLLYTGQLSLLSYARREMTTVWAGTLDDDDDFIGMAANRLD